MTDEYVTPELAREWLDTIDPSHQRRPSKHITDTYARRMAAGEWVESTPEPIAFDSDGRLIQGQHRLRALASTTLPGLRFTVMRGASPAHFAVLDSGFKRTASQLLSGKYPAATAAAARYLMVIDGTKHGSSVAGGVIALNPGNQQVLETVERYQPLLSDLAAPCHQVYVATRIPISVHLAVMRLVADTPYYDKMGDWFRVLHTGLDLSESDPRWHLRKRFGGFRPITDRREQYGFIVKAWNAFATEQPMGLLRMRREDEVPRIVGYVQPALTA